MSKKFRNLLYLATAILVAGAGLFQPVPNPDQALASAALSGEAPQASQPPDGRPEVSETAEGLLLDWHTPPVEITSEAGGAARVTLLGYPAQAEPGEPLLPVGVALVALPPGAAPTLQVLQADEQVLSLPAPIVSAPIPNTNAWGEPLADLPRTIAAAEINGPVRLDDLGLVRGVHVARVTFYPARPEGNTLRLTTHLQVSLDFHAPALVLSTAQVVAASADPVLSALQTAVVNPGQVSPLPAPAQGQVALAEITPIAAIDVITPGLTAITYEALQAAGFTVTDPSHLHLTRRTGGIAQEIALQWDGAVPTTFAPGDRWLFYAAPHFSRWTTTDTYFLSEDNTEGLRMSSRSAAPATLPAGVSTEERTAEVNAIYMPYCWCGQLPPGRDGDHWAWDELKLSSRPSGNYTLSLSAVDATRPATLTVWLIGGTDVTDVSPDHKVSVAINSSAVLTRTQWNGKLAIAATVTVPAGILQNGTNTLKLALPGAGLIVESAWVDAFSIRYARNPLTASGLAATFTGEPTQHAYTVTLASTSGLRAYDITDEAQPVALTDAVTTATSIKLGDPDSNLPRRYALTAAGGIQAPAQVRLVAPLTAESADYLIITHPAFSSTLSSLVALRALSYTVAVENVQAIYDAYDGRPDPAAIRAYLQDAYTRWSLPPAYVLLVGDGTLDPKRYLTTSSTTFIPPYLADIDYGGGETAADNRYVVFTDTTNVPSLLIGRLPVNTLAEAQAVVDKIVRYATHPWPGDWNSTATFVAGVSDPSNYEDFAGQSDTAAATLPVSITPRRLYFAASDPQAAAKLAVQQAWNRGTSLMMYSGHSSWHQWNAAPILFHYSDVANLANAGWLPVTLEMTCFTGFFQRPDMGTLDEALVRRPGGGAVAVWGSTGLGLPSGHEELAAGFITTIYSQTVQTLGQAALFGKVRLSGSFDLRDTYTVLGDPAIQLNTTVQPWPEHVYLPAVHR
jgi:hypothetical protein